MTDAQQPYSDPANQPAAYSPPPAPASYGAPAAPNPGKTLGIVAFVLSFFVQLIALILGIVALVQSRKAGQKNGWAVAAIIISIVLMVLGLILAIAIIIPSVTFAQEAAQACAAVDYVGTVTVRGITVTCDSISR